MQRVHPTMVALTESWLQQRTAHVVVGGQFSDKMVLKNMVFQGTVLGPTLWNLYENARRAIHETGFEEIVYVDDLNELKEFAHNASVVSVMAEAKKCQTELHKWGRANQVSFDPAKDLCILCPTPSRMETLFKLLGRCFDCKLRMDLAVRDVVSQASWKLTTIPRTRRFHGVSQLVQVYQSKVLSFVEYRTPAVYHAAKTTLAGIDAVQRRFLRECGLSDEDALLHFEPRTTGDSTGHRCTGFDSSFGSRMSLCENVFALSAVGFSETRQTTFTTQEPSPFANFVMLCIGTR